MIAMNNFRVHARFISTGNVRNQLQFRNLDSTGNASVIFPRLRAAIVAENIIREQNPGLTIEQQNILIVGQPQGNQHLPIIAAPAPIQAQVANNFILPPNGMQPPLVINVPVPVPQPPVQQQNPNGVLLGAVQQNNGLGAAQAVGIAGPQANPVQIPAVVVYRSVPGFDLGAHGRKLAHTATLLARVVDLGNYYDNSVLATTTAGQYLQPSLQVMLGRELKCKSWIAVCSREVRDQFNADWLAEIQFEIYQVISVSATTLNLQWLQYVGTKRPVDEVAVMNAEISIPVRALTIMPSTRMAEDLKESVTTQTKAAARQSAPPVEGMKCLYEDFNGKHVYFVDKNNIHVRLESSKFLRRLVSDDMVSFMSSTHGIDWNPTDVWEKMVSNGRHMKEVGIEQDYGLVGLPYGLMRWSSIQHTPAMQSNRTMINLLNGTWNGPDGNDFAHLSLQNFSREVLKVPKNSYEDDDFKRRIVLALLHFEHFLVFTCGVIYQEVTGPIRSSIETGPLGRMNWTSDFIRYEVERTIYGVFKIVKNTSWENARDGGLGDITSSHGVRALLHSRFEAIKPLESQMSTYYQTYVNRIKFGPGDNAVTILPVPGPIPVTPAEKQRVVAVVTPLKQAAGAVNDNLKKKGKKEKTCHRDLLFQLGAINNQGEKYSQCFGPPHCTFIHSDVSKASKKEKLDLIHKVLYGKMESQAVAALT
jgi:hypothetical protein